MIAHGPSLSGVALAWWGIGGSAAFILFVAFMLRPYLPAVLVTLMLAAGGVGLTLAGISLRPNPSSGETIIASVTMAVLVPAHVRIVLGRFGHLDWGPESRSGPPSDG